MFGDGTYVEVPLGAAHRQSDVLGWVLAGVESGAYRQSVSGDHTGPLVITDEGVAGDFHRRNSKPATTSNRLRENASYLLDYESVIGYVEGVRGTRDKGARP